MRVNCVWGKCGCNRLPLTWRKRQAGSANELATLAKQVERGQGAADSAGHRLDQAAAGFLLWRQAQTRNALSLYLIEASQLAHLRLEQQVQQVTANLVGRFRVGFDEQTNALATAITQLERAQAQLVSGEDELARTLPSSAKSWWRIQR